MASPEPAKRAHAALLVLCGLPASGKTSLASRLVELFTTSYLTPQTSKLNLANVILVKFDDFLHAELVRESFSQEAWQRSRSLALAHLCAALDTAANEVESGGGHVLVIADDNFHLRSMRHSLFRAARDRGMAFLQAHVDCGLPTALARNQRRTGLAAVPRDALCRMADQFEPPQPERFAWEAASLVVSGEDQGHGEGAHAAQSSSADQSAGEALWSTERVTALVKDLLGLWGPPPPRPPSAAELQRQREEGRAANAASYVHGLDVRSRKALSEAVAAAPDTMRAVVARGLNERRRALLQSARQLLAQAAAAGGTGAGAAAVRDAEAASRAESGEVGENGPPLLQELRWLEEQFMADAGL